VDLARIVGPEPVIAGHVEDPRAALDRRSHGVGLEDVAAHHLDRATLERLEAAGRASEDTDAITVGDEQARHVGSHEAGGAGDQHIHGGATPEPSLLLPRRVAIILTSPERKSQERLWR
jgi:hypothetical protein